jgi:hypothetical protein
MPYITDNERIRLKSPPDQVNYDRPLDTVPDQVN